MPIDCKKCPLMGTDGNPKDLLSPMMCIAIWATTHEKKHCVGGKILDDCPLVEIEEGKGRWILIDEESNTWQCTHCKELGKDDLWQLNSGTPQDNKMDYCPNCGVEMRGANDS